MEDGATAESGSEPPSNGGGVQVEAGFEVGEYDIVILSTNDGSALETWLTDNGYNIPANASTHFTPYVNDDMYFFVAKVDPEKSHL